MQIEDKVWMALGPLLGTIYRFVYGKDIDNWKKFTIILAISSVLTVVLVKLVESNTISPVFGIVSALFVGLGAPNLASAVTRIFQNTESAAVSIVTRNVTTRIQTFVGDDGHKKEEDESIDNS